MDKQVKDKVMKIKGKDYVQVKDRVLFLAEHFEGKYSIDTKCEYFPERKMWVVKATLTLNGCDYTGHGQEVESDNSSDVNYASALENCETSAVGRACAMAGVGVIDSIASVDEITKATNRGSSFGSQKPADPSLPKHTCKKCGSVQPAEIKQGNFGPYFKCSDCGKFSSENPLSDTPKNEEYDLPLNPGF